MAANRPPVRRPQLESLPDRYEIRREVGLGASATVYLAYDSFAKREVALKVARPDIFQNKPENAAVRKAWLNEVHMAGTLHHPYIVEVFDAGVGHDTAYLVMEYLPGGTLEPFTRPDHLKPIDEVMEIVYKCASALDYACRAGIIHRDVKPANLQYVGPGQAKVADFGAAYWMKEDATQIMDIGSLFYMAPELFHQVVTPQADIYALGIVLFMLLTGARPFDAKDQPALIYKIMNGERPTVDTLRSDLPPGIAAFVERMIAPAQAKRFADWSAVLTALGGLMPQLQTSAVEKPAEAELYGKLRHIDVLAPLNDAELWQLLRISRWERVPAGTVLVKEGAEAKSFYLLLDGEAKVVQHGKMLNLLPPGTLFGELAFAEETPSPRAATVIAAEAATVGKAPYSALRAASHELQMKMLQIFFRTAADRLKQADKLYQTLFQQRAEKPD